MATVGTELEIRSPLSSLWDKKCYFLYLNDEEVGFVRLADDQINNNGYVQIIRLQLRSGTPVSLDDIIKVIKDSFDARDVEIKNFSYYTKEQNDFLQNDAIQYPSGSVLLEVKLRPTPESMERLVELLRSIANDNKIICWFDLSERDLWLSIVQHFCVQIDCTPKNAKICFVKTTATSATRVFLCYNNDDDIDSHQDLKLSFDPTKIVEILQILCSHHYIKSFMKCEWEINGSIVSSEEREARLARSYEAINEFRKISALYEQSGSYHTKDSQSRLNSKFGLYYDCTLYKETI